MILRVDDLCLTGDSGELTGIMYSLFPPQMAWCPSLDGAKYASRHVLLARGERRSEEMGYGTEQRR